VAPLSKIAFHQALRGQVRQAVRRVVEAVMAEELAALLQAEPYERSPRRAGRRNGSYTRDLVTPAGVLEDLRVPRDRDGQFRTQVFERFARYQDDVVDSIVEMFFSGVSQGKVQRVTVPLLGTAPSASTVSRLAHGLEAESEAWRKRPLQAHCQQRPGMGSFGILMKAERAV
jgi:transposase-like protein